MTGTRLHLNRTLTAVNNTVCYASSLNGIMLGKVLFSCSFPCFYVSVFINFDNFFADFVDNPPPNTYKMDHVEYPHQTFS